LAQVTAQDPIYRGKACPDGSVSVTFAPDNSSFTVLYDSFVIDSASRSENKGDKIGCFVKIPLTVDPGYRLSITEVDTRGFASLPKHSRASVFSGLTVGACNAKGEHCRHRRMHATRTHFAGGATDNFTITSAANKHNQSTSCGGANMIRIFNSAKLMNHSKDQATFALDSVDAEGSITYQVQVEQCGNDGDASTVATPTTASNTDSTSIDTSNTDQQVSTSDTTGTADTTGTTDTTVTADPTGTTDTTVTSDSSNDSSATSTSETSEDSDDGSDFINVDGP
jgi:hypothetical protein